MTRFKLIAGLVDTDIKEDILSMNNMNLKETVKVVEGKESGKVAKLKVGVQDAKVYTVKADSKHTMMASKLSPSSLVISSRKASDKQSTKSSTISCPLPPDDRL